MSTTLKTWLKRGAKALGVLLLIVLLVVAGALIFLQTRPGKNLLKDQILSLSAGALAGSLEIGRIEGNLLGGVRIYEVVVRDARGNIAALIPSASADYSLTQLMRSELKLDSVRVENPVIIGHVYSDGTLNLLDIAAPSDEPGEPSQLYISLARAEVVDATLLYYDQDADTASQQTAGQPPAQTPMSRWLEQLNEARDAAASPAFSELMQRAATLATPLEASQSAGAPLTLVALSKLDIEASFYMYPGAQMSGTLRALDGEFLSNAAQGAAPLKLQDIHFLKSATRLEAALAHISLGTMAKIEDLAVGVDFETEPDRQGNPVIVAPSELIAEVGAVRVEDGLRQIFAPDAPEIGAIHASLAVGGTLEKMNLIVHAGCGDGPEERALTLGATLSFPENMPADLGYEAALLINDLNALDCIKLDAARTDLSGALVASGRGVDPQKLRADAQLSLQSSRVGDYKIDALYVSARAEDARFTLAPLRALTPYGRVEASGHFDLNRGDYQVQLDADANPELRELLERTGDTPMQTDFARVSLKSEGTLDVGAPSPVAKVARASLTADWEVRGAQVETYQLASSRGDIDFSIKPGAQPETRAIELRADLDARGLDTPPAKAQFLGVKAQASATVALPIDDILAALERLSSTWRVQARALRAGDIRVQSADLNARASRNRPGAPVAWTLDGTLDGARFQTNQLKSARFDLGGSAALQTQERAESSSIALGTITAAGDLNLQGLRAGSASVESASARVDVRGRPPNLSGHVDLHARQVRAGGEEIEDLDARVALEAGGRFDVQASATRVVPSADARGGADISPGEQPGARRTQQLRVAARGEASSNFQKFEFDQLELGSPDISFSAPAGASVDLRGGGVRLSGVSLQSGDTAISADGQLNPRGAQDFHLKLTNVQLGELRQKFELQSLLPPVRGEVNGSVDVVGTAREPIISINLSLRDLYYESYGPFDLDLKAHYEARELSVETLEVRAYTTPILRASGQLPLELSLSAGVAVPLDKMMDLTLSVPPLQIESFYDALPFLEQNNVEGAVMAAVGLSGTVENPQIDVLMDVKDMVFSGELGNELVEIDQISTRLQGSYKPPSVSRGGIQVDYHVDWRGEQIVVAHLSSPMPIASWVRQSLDENAAPLDLARVLDNVPLEVALKVAGLELSDVPTKSFADADAAGALTLDLSADGTFSQPRVGFSLRLDGFGWDQYRDIDILGELSLRDQILRIDQFRVDWTDEQILGARGQVPLPTEMLFGEEALDDLPIEFQVQLHEFALNRLGVIDFEFAKYKGALAAYFQVDGTLSRPQFHGRAGLFNTQLSGGQLGTIAFEFQGGDDRVQVDGSVCRGYETMLDLHADLPITTNILKLAAGDNMLAEGPIRGKITSQKMRLRELFPEELVSNYISDPQGTLSMDLSLSGDWQMPKILGSVNVDNAAVTLAYFGRRFTGINLDLSATDTQILLRKLRVQEENSYIEAKGDVQFEGVKPSTVTAQFESKEFNIGGFVPNMTAFISSRADISGDLSGETRKLRADFTELNVTVPESQGGDLYPTELDDELIVLSRQRDQNQMMDIDKLLASSGDPAAKKTRTQIRVTAGGTSWVHHPMADVNFKADITATLGGPAVQVTGSVGTIRGSAEMIGKQFDIPEQENAIRFTGDSPPDPALDVRALHILDREITAEIGEPSDGEPRIIIHVRGRATSPSLVLESDPPLSETEILYVLMTGRAPSQAGAGEESRVSSLALSAASGIFAGMLQERLSGTLPLDVVRLQPGEDGFNDLRVQIGKYVTDDIFVSYVLRLGADEGEGMNVIKLDYRFLPSWRLGFQLSNQLNGEANILWDIY